MLAPSPTLVRRTLTLVALATLVLLQAGCIRSIDPALDAFELSPRLDENYDITYWPTAIAVGADAGNPHGTNRMAFWRRSDPTVADVETCATWTSTGHPFHQEGATLRLRPVGEGVRAITVTKNVYLEQYWIFNIHVWDTNDPEASFAMVGTFDLSATLGGGTTGQPVVPFPWRLCARAQGNVVDFVVWPASQARPPYGTAGRGGSATVGGNWLDPGTNGWFAGHLQPDSSIWYSDPTVTPL
jgi:hypothetical protein